MEHSESQSTASTDNMDEVKLDYSTDVLGVELSKDAPVVVWDNGTVTAVPHIPCNDKGRNTNALAKDEEAVRALAYLAAEDLARTWIKYPDMNDPKLVELCRGYLARGHVLVLRGHQAPLPPPSPEGHITAEYLQRLRYDVDGVLYPVHDAARRCKNFKHPYVEMTLRKFVARIRDQNAVQAILSAPSPRTRIPEIILDLDDSHQPFKGGLRDLFPPTGEVSEDSEALRSWGLFHSAGFHTYSHKDAGGFCTFVHVEHGIKMWTVIRPGNGYLEATDSKDLVSKTMPMINFQDGSGKTLRRQWENANPEVALLQLDPGDMIIMPPGTWHEVYTPVQGFCSGGHFLLQDALHLTASSRLFDRQHGLAATNDNHPSIYRTLCRMLLHLTRLHDRTLYLRPVLALCRMVLYRDEYRIQGQGKGTKEEAQDSMRDECQMASIVALTLIKDLGHPKLKKDQAVFFAEVSWTDPGIVIPPVNLEKTLTGFKGTALVLQDGKDPHQSNQEFVKAAKDNYPGIAAFLNRANNQASKEIEK